MNAITKTLFALIAVGLLALAAGCSTSYKVLSVEDHPEGDVTLIQTLTTDTVGGVYNESRYNYWECKRSDAGLDCEKTCWNKDQASQWPESAPEDGAQCLGYVNPNQ